MYVRELEPGLKERREEFLYSAFWELSQNVESKVKLSVEASGIRQNKSDDFYFISILFVSKFQLYYGQNYFQQFNFIFNV